MPDVAAVPAIIGRCPEKMRLQEQFNGDGDGVKGRIVPALIRRQSAPSRHTAALRKKVSASTMSGVKLSGKDTSDMA